MLANSCVLLVSCVVPTNSSTMAAAGAIPCSHLPDGNIQWHRVKPWMCSIGRCAPCRTAASACRGSPSQVSHHVFRNRNNKCSEVPRHPSRFWSERASPINLLPPHNGAPPSPPVYTQDPLLCMGINKKADVRACRLPWGVP